MNESSQHLTGDEKYILYIQWGEKLDPAFIRLAAEFKEYNVSLIPVKISEIDYFITRHQVPVIMTTSSMAELSHFKKAKKRHLDYLVRTSKIRLFHLNSFSLVPEYYGMNQKRSYIHVPLPIHFKQAALLVLSEYLVDVSGNRAWPGGKRSKLPAMPS